MQYTVIYRGKNGRRDQLVLEASSRDDVFAKLKERGIAAISVKEGAAKSTSAKSPSVGRGAVKGAIVGLLVVALGFLAWLFVGNGILDGGKGDTEKPAKKIDKGSKSVAGSTSSATATNQVQEVATSTPEDDLPPDQRIVKESYTIKTNGHGKIIERFKTADGKSHMVIGHVEPTFVEPSDQLLAMAMSGRTDGLGAPPPMPGGVSDAAFMESLKTEIVINDDDPPEVRDVKQKVIDARADALAMIKEGRSLDDILSEHHKLAMENDSIRRECQQELKRLVESGDMEGAQRYRDVMSLALQQMGIAELRMPMTDEEREELIERRKAAKAEAEARRAAAAAEAKK